MLNIKFEYRKGDVERKCSKSIKSNIVRVEGKNESGKTLFLEVLAKTFCLTPSEIQDSSLRDFFEGFLNEDLGQQIKFSVGLDEGRVHLEANKDFTEKSPLIKIDGKIRNSDYIRRNFYVYFDSIKSPKIQAEQYQNECQQILNNLSKHMDRFLTYISRIKKDIGEYINAENTIKEQRQILDRTKKEITEIEDRLPKFEEKEKQLKTISKIKELSAIYEDIEALKKQRDQLKIKREEKRHKEIRTREIVKEILDKRSNYLGLIKKFEAFGVARDLPQEANFLTNLKPTSSVSELEDATKKIAVLKSKYNAKSNATEADKNYEKLQFIKRLREFIRNNFPKFKEFYPDFYERIEKDYKKIEELDTEIRTLEKWISSLEAVFTAIDDYLKVLKENDVTPLDLASTSNEDDSRKVLRELTSEIKDKEEQYNRGIDEVGNQIEALAPQSKRYTKETLEKELLELQKKIAQLNSAKIDAGIKNGVARTLIDKNESIMNNPPKYSNNLKELVAFQDSTGRIISAIKEAEVVISKIKEEKQDFNPTELTILKNIGKFFGNYQIEMLHNFKIRKVKEIDLLSRTYILDDGTVVNFRSNPGKILVNTLLSKIRNLPENKKSILLIDEVSPLDPDNIELLEKEVKTQIRSGKVLFGAIAIPGSGYQDQNLHIIEL